MAYPFKCYVASFTARGFEIEDYGIHAIAFAGRRRTVVEEMSEMRATAAAEDFRSVHVQGCVQLIGDRAGADGLEETWPAAGAGELGVRPEERVAAGGAVVRADAFMVPVFACKCRLSCLHARDGVDARRKNLLPDRIGEPEDCCVCS